MTRHLAANPCIYRIAGYFSEHSIRQIGLKRLLANLNLANLSLANACSSYVQVLCMTSSRKVRIIQNV